MAMSEKRRLVFNEGLLQVERTIIEREISAEDFLQQLQATMVMDTGPLPQGGAYLRSIDTESRPVTLYIIERDPGLYSFRYRVFKKGHPSFNSNDESKNSVLLTVSWPRTLWFYRFVRDVLETVWLASTQQPLLQAYRDTPIYQVLMPNVHGSGSGHFCTGSDIAMSMTVSMGSRVQFCHDFLHTSSYWNADLYPKYENTGVDSLFEWHELTQKDPNCHTKLNFPRHGLGTVGGMIDHLIRKAA